MTRSLDRRAFIGEMGAGAIALSGAGAGARPRQAATAAPTPPAPRPVPSYLAGYESLYAQDPRAAAVAWFRDARFGLFMHFGLYSLLGRHEWVMWRENIPLGEYEKLKDEFTAERFDADFITDLALEAGMRYVNITSRHHEGFCLFASGVTDYTSAAAPARRDLVGELAEQCAAKGLGLFLYYSYALDWRHPYFYPRSYFRIARPDYPEGEPRYLFRRDEDFRHYIAFVHAQLRELLTGYGPLAGVWLDPIMGYYARPDLYPIEETYGLIRSLQPQTLISFKQGASGDEDFTAPERGARSLEENVRRQCGEAQALVARRAWDGNTGKPRESCNTLQPHSWGYMQADDGKHRTADDVMALLAEGREQSWNLLLNTGPLPDGSIHTEDVATLREVGRRRAERQSDEP